MRRCWPEHTCDIAPDGTPKRRRPRQCQCPPLGLTGISGGCWHTGEVQQLPSSVRTLWRVGGLLSGLVMGVVLGGPLLGAVLALEVGVVGYIGVGVVVLGVVGLSVWWAGVRYRNWTWQVTDKWVEAKHGVLGRHRVIIPRNRIQTVTTNSGPVDRMLDLETITVHTAGAGAPNLTIPHLTTATVAQIRRDLGQGVREHAADEQAVVAEGGAADPVRMPPPGTTPTTPTTVPPVAPPLGASSDPYKPPPPHSPFRG